MLLFFFVVASRTLLVHGPLHLEVFNGKLVGLGYVVVRRVIALVLLVKATSNIATQSLWKSIDLIGLLPLLIASKTLLIGTDLIDLIDW